MPTKLTQDQLNALADQLLDGQGESDELEPVLVAAFQDLMHAADRIVRARTGSDEAGVGANPRCIVADIAEDYDTDTVREWLDEIDAEDGDEGDDEDTL